MAHYSRPVRMMSSELSRLLRAGEVVGGPYSIVKELCENALDSGCSKIKVILSTDGGRSMIMVEDNGHGMTPEDLELCLLPHASSKTYVSEEIENPVYLGFRGEALASITACADIEIRSRQKDGDCWSINAEHGIIKEVKPCSGEIGTKVIVRDLFKNLPARASMLKTNAKEIADVRKAIEHITLSRHDVSFVFQIDKKTILSLPAQKLLERIEYLTDKVEGIEIKGELNGWAINGKLFIGSKPKIENKFIVAGRAVIRDSALQAALVQVSNTLAKGRHHSFWGILTIPDGNVAHNVHAAKEEIRYCSTDNAKEFLVKMILDSVREARGSGYSHSWEGNGFHAVEMGDVTGVLGKVVGISGDNYIVSLTDNGLILVDAHAAHERILLERFKTALNVNIVDLPVPLVIAMRGSEMDKFLNCELQLSRQGFITDNMGDGYIILRSIPLLMSGMTEVMFKNIVNACSEGHDLLMAKMADMACRAAFRTNDGLSMEFANQILRDMECTPGSGFCNHGRPTCIKLINSGMAKLFGR